MNYMQSHRNFATTASPSLRQLHTWMLQQTLAHGKKRNRSWFINCMWWCECLWASQKSSTLSRRRQLLLRLVHLNQSSWLNWTWELSCLRLAYTSQIHFLSCRTNTRNNPSQHVSSFQKEVLKGKSSENCLILALCEQCASLARISSPRTTMRKKKRSGKFSEQKAPRGDIKAIFCSASGNINN